MLFLRLLLALALAFGAGKLLTKFNLPAILGWLIMGIIIGPNVIGVMNHDLLNASWYGWIIDLSQVLIGIMLGSNLVLEEIRAQGTENLKLSWAEIIITFIVVSVGLGGVFYLLGYSPALGIVIGAISTVTAPAPALSIIDEYDTDGPLTDTMESMSILNSLFGNMFFFVVIAIMQTFYIDSSDSILATLFMSIIAPLLIGVLLGYISGRFVDPIDSKRTVFFAFLAVVFLSYIAGKAIDSYIFSTFNLNYLLLGIGFAAAFVNVGEVDDYSRIEDDFGKFESFALLLVIINLSAPLEPRLIFTAGLLPFIYIIIRAIGKYLGGYFGAQIAGKEDTVKKYLGIVMLPHAGISLVLEANSHTLVQAIEPNYANIITITLSAAVIINEFIGILLSNKAYEKAGEVKQN
ncbi:cation:proton antiporter [Aerococcaceae bacterium DSM 111020]|nr:cation:proton antiporter [Aerococcaceae bacterium DSM 111020]